jgi:hypothetical protein
MSDNLCFKLCHTKSMMQLYLALGHHHFAFFKVYYALNIPLLGSLQVNLFNENVVKRNVSS